jgi:hypothetical protein
VPQVPGKSEARTESFAFAYNFISGLMQEAEAQLAASP